MNALWVNQGYLIWRTRLEEKRKYKINIINMSSVVHPEKESIVLDSVSNKPDQEAEGLSFFTANDNDTSSESDSDEETEKTTINNGTTEPQAADKNKLPSPSTLFATVGKPKFLDRLLEDEEVDWQSLSKRYEPLFEYSSVSCPVETVDLTSAERVEATISGAPIKYKAEISETKRHLFLHGKRSVDLSNAAEGPSTGTQDAETSSKKQKSS